MRYGQLFSAKSKTFVGYIIDISGTRNYSEELQNTSTSMYQTYSNYYRLQVTFEKCRKFSNNTRTIFQIESSFHGSQYTIYTTMVHIIDYKYFNRSNQECKGRLSRYIMKISIFQMQFGFEGELALCHTPLKF